MFACALFLLASCECVTDIETPKKITPDQYANVLFADCNSDFDYLKFITESGTVLVHSYYLDNRYFYQQIIPGLATINIKGASDSVLFNSVMELQKAMPYTFLAYGTLNRMQSMLLVDTVPSYSPNNSYFRFVNLSNEAPYSMIKVAGTYPIQIIQPFRTASRFYPTYSGLYNIDVINATNDSLMTSRRNFVMEPGKMYTFVLRGYFNGFGNQKMNLWLIESDFLLKRQEEDKLQ